MNTSSLEMQARNTNIDERYQIKNEFHETNRYDIDWILADDNERAN